VKFLVDNCVGRELAEWLRSRGHDAVYSPELGPDPGDDDLLAVAARDGRVVITHDKGFARSVFLAGANSTAMIFLPDLRPITRRLVIEGILALHSSDLEQGAWIILRNDKLRIRRRDTKPDQGGEQ
jgi:predicted nuclease of predicted toxin-antitoxin system